MENINKNIFSVKLNDIFKENIKLSFVSALSVIIVTNDDKFYEFKRNSKKNLLIALSDNKSKLESLIEESLVEKLSNIRVVDLKNSWYHSIARTYDGKVYNWGLNFWGVLGNGSEDCKAYGPELNKVLIEENVVDMCCNYIQTIVLTIDGEVYTWGKNFLRQYDILKTCPQKCQPFKLTAFNGEKVKAIACGSRHTLALTGSGHVYSWGFNKFGQLGVGNEVYYWPPKLMQLNKRIIIKKISCGFLNSLLLSSGIDIYMCGNLGYRKKMFTPIKLEHSEKFINIASHSHWSLCAAVSVKNIFYFWGKYGEKVITTPQKTHFKTFNEIFEHFLKISYEPIEGRVIRFDEGFIQNDKYEKYFNQKNRIASGSYGKVFEVNTQHNENIKYAMKKIKFKAKYGNEFMKELENYPVIFELNHKNIVKYFDAWLENDYISKNGIKTYNPNFIV